MLERWGMSFTSSLISFQSPFWPEVVAPDRVLSIGQIEQLFDAGHCWRSKDELISDVLLWTPTYGRAKAGWPARTYIQQLCEYTGCNPEDLLEAMDDREKWRERVRDIRAGGTTWCWWFMLNWIVWNRTVSSCNCVENINICINNWLIDRIVRIIWK